MADTDRTGFFRRLIPPHGTKRTFAYVALAAGGLILAAGVASSMTGGCRNVRTRVAERSIHTAPPSTTFAAAEDWPKWRGPRGDGISREAGLAGTWPDGGPKQLWSAEVGIGQSSPVAAGGRVYLFSLDNGVETLTCFDAGSGKILWNQPGQAGWTRSYPGTRATPAIDGDSIYTYGGNGDLTCRELATGASRWTINTLKETGATNGGWGAASSPLVAGPFVYVQVRINGPVAVAVDKRTGKIAWRSEARGTAGYAHPLLIDVEGTPQLVVFGGEAVYGLNPETGATIWNHPWPTDYQVNASTPVYSDGHLFVTSAYGQGAVMLRLSPAGATKLWEKKEIQSRFQGAVLDAGVLYANSEGTLMAVRWPDGKTLWKNDSFKLGVGGSFVRVPGDRLILLSERGKLGLARANAAGFELIARADGVDGTEVWSTPLIYGGRLYAKGRQELICFDLSDGSR